MRKDFRPVESIEKFDTLWSWFERFGLAKTIIIAFGMGGVLANFSCEKDLNAASPRRRFSKSFWDVSARLKSGPVTKPALQGSCLDRPPKARGTRPFVAGRWWGSRRRWLPLTADR